jgi:hypothetical protein
MKHEHVPCMHTDSCAAVLFVPTLKAKVVGENVNGYLEALVAH